MKIGRRRFYEVLKSSYQERYEEVYGNSRFIVYKHPNVERILLWKYAQLFPEKATHLQPNIQFKNGNIFANRLKKLSIDRTLIYLFQDLSGYIGKPDVNIPDHLNKYSLCLTQGFEFLEYVICSDCYKNYRLDFNNPYNFGLNNKNEICWFDPIYLPSHYEGSNNSEDSS